MIDELFDRTYQSGRAEVNAGLTHLFSRAGRAVANAFAVLNKIEYHAPWQERKNSSHHAC